MTETIVRLAALDDAEVLAQLRWDFKTEGSPSGCGWDDQETFVRECASWIQQRLAEGSWQFWLAETDGRPVGHVCIQLVERVPDPGGGPKHWGYLTNLYVDSQFRNRGVGRSLLDHAREWAHRHQLDTVIVWPSDRSRDLYQRAGFMPSDEILEHPARD